MKTGHSWKEGIGVSVVVGMIMLSMLFIPAESEAQSEWVQTTQADFDSAITKWNVDTTSDPGNVSLVPSSTDWVKAQVNPVVDVGLSGEWDESDVALGSVVKEGNVYNMWYHGLSAGGWRIGLAQSDDGLSWTKDPSNPVLDQGLSGTWDSAEVSDPVVMKDGDTYRMWYTGYDGSNWGIGYAESTDGTVWTKHDLNPVLNLNPLQSWEAVGVMHPFVIREDVYKMWYSGYDGSNWRTGYAESVDGLDWTRHSANPVLDLGLPGSWEDVHVYDSSVSRIGNLYGMWYTSYGGSPLRHKIGYASSLDGVNWTKYGANPVLGGGPSAWDGVHVTGPFVLKDDYVFRMWFCGQDGSTWRIGLATSSALVNWTRIAVDPVLPPASGSGWDSYSRFEPSVLLDGDSLSMYFGGNDADGAPVSIGLATSTDGYDWTAQASPVLPRGNLGEWDAEDVRSPSVIAVDGSYEMYYTGVDTQPPMTLNPLR
jgi:predicted GH43/DUF377 family glycosyl hydrolase